MHVGVGVQVCVQTLAHAGVGVQVCRCAGILVCVFIDASVKAHVCICAHEVCALAGTKSRAFAQAARACTDVCAKPRTCTRHASCSAAESLSALASQPCCGFSCCLPSQQFRRWFWGGFWDFWGNLGAVQSLFGEDTRMGSKSDDVCPLQQLHRSVLSTRHRQNPSECDSEASLHHGCHLISFPAQTSYV